jgi:NAD(P)-dependent dehydrogenase (short-subunit alcohol dehydrogenase family)
MAEIRFNGKVAVVTGAGAGIGKAYALGLARRGAKVVVNDLGSGRDGAGASSSAADTVVDEIKQAGGEAVASYDSVSSVEGGEAIVRRAVEAFGRVDILINNAGILRDKTFLKMSEEEWDAVISVHLKGAYCVTRPAFQLMRENGYGRIVFTSSTSGLYGNFGQTNYAAAKMGLVGFMNALKLEGAKYNILVNTVAPNAASRMTEDVLPKEILEKLKPEFIVPLVLYLCSESNIDSGNIFVAGAGWYGRTALVCNPGAAIGDTKRDISVEEIRESWSAIMNLDAAKHIASNTDVFQFMAPLFAK